VNPQIIQPYQMSNKKSRTQKLILNWKRPHGLIRREWRKRRIVECDSVRSSYTNKKATKLSRLVFHKDLLLCPIILIIKNALINMLVVSVFQILGTVTKCKLYFHHHVHFTFFSKSENFGGVRSLHVFLFDFWEANNNSVLCSSTISTSVGIWLYKVQFINWFFETETTRRKFAFLSVKVNIKIAEILVVMLTFF
jgi:hypothetical protein